MHSIFKKSIELNMKIEKFLDAISNSLLLFNKMIRAYLKSDESSFCELSKRISDLESQADNLETEIKVSLYKFLLLPDVRADVLSLVKSLDNIIDLTEEIAKNLFIQRPNFPPSLHDPLLEMVTTSIDASDALLLASRSFLSDVHNVNAHINKIKFHEHEGDILEEKLMKMVFSGEIVSDLAEKLQLNTFINHIADISDEAELIGDKLTIFTIKREI